MTTDVKRLGIISGGGQLPLEIAEHARKSGIDVHVVAIDGEADADFSNFDVTRVNWGGLGKMIASNKSRDISDLVIVGRVTRPDFKRVRPDFGFFKNIPRIINIVRSGGDDSVLRNVIKFFEAHGFRVLGVPDVAPQVLIGEGTFCGEPASEDDQKDIAIGFDIIRRLGQFDVGQGVVVSSGVVEALEGAEGTDRMLERIAHLRVTKFSQSQRGVLVKRPKPNQEMRIDLPTIGPKTATLASRAGLAGIAVLKNATIVAEREQFIAAAEESQLFVEGCSDDSDAPAEKASFDGEISFVQLGNVKMTRNDDYDLKQALGVLEAVAPYQIGGAVAVARKHVLAIEVGEGLEAFMERVKSLRQWGGGLAGDRVGMAICGSTAPYGTKLVSAAQQAGLKGIVIASDGLSKQEWSTAIVNADTRNLFIGALTVSH